MKYGDLRTDHFEMTQGKESLGAYLMISYIKYKNQIVPTWQTLK